MPTILIIDDEPSMIEYWLERARLVLQEIPHRTDCAVPDWP